ncbi:sensor histidine kinase [Flaviflagellibacter deserti]|uniref:Blue-light-activated histidine kinase n=1 Tax=Flaviflagellibacter deserti TaxID=2267266 RepID=A0ABV9Z1G6_9HYPH
MSIIRPLTEMQKHLAILNSSDRLRALRSTSLLDSETEERFDRLTRLVARSLGVAVSLVSLVEDDRQFFKSEFGLPEPWKTARETPLTHSFCQYVVSSEQALEVSDATTHPLVRDNRAIDDLGVRAYLGLPLRGPGGHVLGSLCAIDDTPREWSDEDRQILADFVALVETQINVSWARNLAENERIWRDILDTTPQMVWSATPDGSPDYYNEQWYAFTGIPHGATDGDGWTDVFHPDDRERSLSRWRQSWLSGEPYEIEYRLRHRSGEYRWTLGRGVPQRDETGQIKRWFGTLTDIHDLKLAEEQRDLVTRELAHRIKNIFALVASLVSLSGRASPDNAEFARELSGRIVALARAHDCVSPGTLGDRPNDPQSLRRLLETLIEPHRDHAGTQIAVVGDDAVVGHQTATGVALIVHELATNAVKYGALSPRGGSIAVDCRDLGNRFAITWREDCAAPATDAPNEMGFGSVLIERAAKAQLGASITREWGTRGLTLSIEIPDAQLAQ